MTVVTVVTLVTVVTVVTVVTEKLCHNFCVCFFNSEKNSKLSYDKKFKTQFVTNSTVTKLKTLNGDKTQKLKL